MGRSIVLGICLTVTTSGWLSAADDNSVNGSMTVGRKTYKLTSVKAFRIKSDGRDSIAVIASEKPFQLTKPTFFPEDKPRWIDLESISLPTQFEQIRDVVPHMQVVFDEKTGKVTSYQGWADGATFVSIEKNFIFTVKINDVITKSEEVGHVTGSWNGTIEGKRIVGSGKHTDDGIGGQTFDFDFNVAIEQLEIVPQPK